MSLRILFLGVFLLVGTACRATSTRRPDTAGSFVKEAGDERPLCEIGQTPLGKSECLKFESQCIDPRFRWTESKVCCVDGEGFGRRADGSCNKIRLEDPTTLPEEAKCADGRKRLAGVCWYHGQRGESCSSTCASRGGYDEATSNAATSDVACESVLNHLDIGVNRNGAPNGGTTRVHFAAQNPHALGCYTGTSSVASDDVMGRYRAPSTRVDDKFLGSNRACACKN